MPAVRPLNPGIFVALHNEAVSFAEVGEVGRLAAVLKKIDDELFSLLGLDAAEQAELLGALAEAGVLESATT